MSQSILFVFLLGLPGLTLAQDCTEIEDDAERLACYDTLNRASSPDPVERQSPSPPAAQAERHTPPTPAQQETGMSETSVNAAATIAADSPEEFGKKEPFDAPREYIEATIVEIQTDGLKISYLRLDNGQIWRDVEDSRVRFKEGRKVTITEGILGSFDLQMEGYNKIVKVKRIE